MGLTQCLLHPLHFLQYSIHASGLVFPFVQNSCKPVELSACLLLQIVCLWGSPRDPFDPTNEEKPNHRRDDENGDQAPDDAPEHCVRLVCLELRQVKELFLQVASHPYFGSKWNLFLAIGIDAINLIERTLVIVRYRGLDNRSCVHQFLETMLAH